MRHVTALLALGVALPGLAVVLEGVAWSLGHPLLPAIEGVTGPWCHQDPARTLRLGGELLPVCARCTGLYGGLVVGPVVGLLLPWRGRALARVSGLLLAPLAIGLLAAIAEALGLVHTTNGARVALGGLLTLGPAALGLVGARVLGDAITGLASSAPVGPET